MLEQTVSDQPRDMHAGSSCLSPASMSVQLILYAFPLHSTIFVCFIAFAQCHCSLCLCVYLISTEQQDAPIFTTPSRCCCHCNLCACAIVCMCYAVRMCYALCFVELPHKLHDLFHRSYAKIHICANMFICICTRVRMCIHIKWCAYNYICICLYHIIRICIERSWGVGQLM